MNPKGHVLESIEDYGFGKGFLAAEEEFRKLLGALDVMQHKRDVHVMMLAHSKVVTFKNPAGPDFDRYELKCQARVASVIKEWAENVLFIFHQVDASKISEDKERHKTAPDKARAKGMIGERMIGAQKSAMYDAKNRVRMDAETPLTDPNAIVSMLLGEHLGDSVKAVADRVEKESPRKRASETKRETTRRDEPERARDDNGSQSREPARRDEPERKSSRGHDDPPRSKDADKTESRTWTEPKRDVAPPPPSRASELDVALKDASSLGELYRRKVDGWVAKANADADAKSVPSKIAAIVKRVNADVVADAELRAREAR